MLISILNNENNFSEELTSGTVLNFIVARLKGSSRKTLQRSIPQMQTPSNAFISEFSLDPRKSFFFYIMTCLFLFNDFQLAQKIILIYIFPVQYKHS